MGSSHIQEGGEISIIFFFRAARKVQNVLEFARKVGSAQGSMDQREPSTDEIEVLEHLHPPKHDEGAPGS